MLHTDEAGFREQMALYRMTAQQIDCLVDALDQRYPLRTSTTSTVISPNQTSPLALIPAHALTAAAHSCGIDTSKLRAPAGD